MPGLGRFLYLEQEVWTGLTGFFKFNPLPLNLAEPASKRNTELPRDFSEMRREVLNFSEKLCDFSVSLCVTTSCLLYKHLICKLLIPAQNLLKLRLLIQLGQALFNQGVGNTFDKARIQLAQRAADNALAFVTH